MKKPANKINPGGLLLLIPSLLFAETGYSLWLRYVKNPDSTFLAHYRANATQIVVQETSPTINAATEELKNGIGGLLDKTMSTQSAVTMDGSIVIGTDNCQLISDLGLNLQNIPEAYKIISTVSNDKKIIVVASRGELGVLYGCFHLLRLIQTREKLINLNISESPKIKHRLLNHWDNLDGTVERGYAGRSLWKWSTLPEQTSKRYIDYARACASIGINGTVLNNVNANTGTNFNILSTPYLNKIKILADLFRPYGIRVYLSVSFASPQRVGNLGTSDPLNSSVITWWAQKVDEIYKLIPDFGGFLVKANSEGQPGPKTYDRTHAQGANCLADALSRYGGIVIWRAFVYDDDVDTDRLKRAYMEFKPLDGQFRSNVIIQAKNGPFDFQPREPVHPLFGALPKTHIGIEFQITKEYLGWNIHLVYLGTYWKEVLDFETYANGPGSTVGKILDGSMNGDTLTCIAGVANTGSDTNWCGSHFDQVNWYAFGRLTWNHLLSAEQVADEWIKMTWSHEIAATAVINQMLSGSHEACVNYMNPLGLGGIFAYGNHYGPDPGYDNDPAHPDWNSVYWHKADISGLGYDRSENGSKFVNQYFYENKIRFNNLSTCPTEYLCWFFHVPWGQPLNTGRTFWNELCFRYYEGANYVNTMKSAWWPSLASYIDAERFNEVSEKLSLHYINACAWRDTCINYFMNFSKLPIPEYTNSNKKIEKSTGISDNSTTMYIYDLQGRLLSAIVPSRNRNDSYHSILKAIKVKQSVIILK